MRIIDAEKLEKFVKKHTDAESAVKRWVEIIQNVEWKNHNELKNDFLSADYIGNDRYVFNIKGNNYRIVAVVVFFGGRLYIRFVGTHADYDRINAKKV